jgi:hypothetical protein
MTIISCVNYSSTLVAQSYIALFEIEDANTVTILAVRP